MSLRKNLNVLGNIQKRDLRTHFKFSSKAINQSICILLLVKSVYSYKYMDDRQNFNETSLSEKEEFCSKLNMEEITVAVYMHSKRVCKGFEIKKLGKYRDLYLKNDAQHLLDVFEDVRDMCLKVYHLDPSKFTSAPELGWQAALKKIEELLADFDLLSVAEKGIGGEICHKIC